MARKTDRKMDPRRIERLCIVTIAEHSIFYPAYLYLFTIKIIYTYFEVIFRQIFALFSELYPFI